MTNKVFAEKLKEIATSYKTLYVMGCFGAPMTPRNKQRYTQNHPYNQDKTRTKMIKEASEDTFGFDCVCLIKGVLWGWKGCEGLVYGGADYQTNNVPDIDADEMIKRCNHISTDFKDIVVGEAVWMKGHIGVYVGNGFVVECSPRWKNGVQITAVADLGFKLGYNSRHWTKHGRLPWISYIVVEDPIRRKYIENLIKTVKEKMSTYTVKKGDTLTRIAEKHHTTVTKLAEANNIEDVNVIHTGQRIKIV